MSEKALKKIYDQGVNLMAKDPLNANKRSDFDQLIKWLKDRGLDVTNMDKDNQPSTTVEASGQQIDGPSTSGQSAPSKQCITASQLMADNEEEYEVIDITHEDSDEEVDEVMPKMVSVGRPSIVLGGGGEGGPRAKRSYVVDSRVQWYINPGSKCGVSGCGHRSRNMSSLVEHIKRHLKIKDFKCKKCSKSFVTSYEMNRHFCRYNTNDRQMNCN